MATDDEILARAQRLHAEDCGCPRTKLDGPLPKASGYWEWAEAQLEREGK